jgi:hypothetical protein
VTAGPLVLLETFSPVFRESIAHYDKLLQDGQIDGFVTFLLAPHSGDLDGFIIMHGEQSKLDAVRSSPEFLRLVTRAGAVGLGQAHDPVGA